MSKTFVGPRMRRLRREREQTQAEMASDLGVSAAYINLLENNQRALSIQMLMAISDTYGVDWRDLVTDTNSSTLAELRSAVHDPIFANATPDLQELRSALDHAPMLVDSFLTLYRSHRATIDSLMHQGGAQVTDRLLLTSPESIIHDFFRNHRNHFPKLEAAAEDIRQDAPFQPEDVFATLKLRLKDKHKVRVRMMRVEDMSQALRVYNAHANEVLLSEALDHQNRVFQLSHVLGLLEINDLLDEEIADSGISSDTGRARCRVELANYFAAAFLMPYSSFLDQAERTGYDIDRIGAAFGVSFEQVSQRLTTLQREGAEGVPFFFLRVDKAGNVNKRFNATSFNLAEHGGACPVWNIHTAFRTPGVIIPQFVELPEGERFFTISRTTDRPVLSRDSQDRRLTIALGCDFRNVEKIGYAESFNTSSDLSFSQIGINCHLCPRQACSQRAHQPIFVDLPIDESRRGNTRYES